MAKHTSSPLDSIKCPECGALIPITETLHLQLAEQAKAELRQQIAKERKALTEKERQLKKREASLVSAEQDIEKRLQKRLEVEKAKLRQAALDTARGEVAVELADVRADAAEKAKKLKEAQDAELKLRKDKRDLEEAKRNLQLEVARTLDQERERIREEAAHAALEEHHLKDAEKDKKLQDALRMNEELRRKLEQGSQQTQGEVLELQLEEILRANYPMDDIEPVPKGMRGADVIQTVRAKSGALCGSIIWESKRTKAWSDGWITKLKDDQRIARADVAVIVTEVLPKDLDGFGLRDGIWIAHPRFVLGLATALRVTLSEVAFTKRASASKNETVEAVFQYLTGPEFRQRVEAIVTAFVELKNELDEEKRIAIRRWNKREKQIERVIANTSGMYGDLQGLIGGSMQSIPSLDAHSEEPSELAALESAGPVEPDEPSEDEIPF
ncbi:MAG: DUF2130 domain-containing protein [Acidobacteria bacterium]|nr:DUF2130 domain-containing protein [Acidobacteriota bacterium]